MHLYPKMNKAYFLISIILQSVISSMKAVSFWTESGNFCLLWELRVIFSFALHGLEGKHDVVMWECLLLRGHCGRKDGNYCILRSLL